MPYLSCDDAGCEEKSYTGYDCYGDHWVPDPVPEWAFDAVAAVLKIARDEIKITRFHDNVIRYRVERPDELIEGQLILCNIKQDELG